MDKPRKRCTGIHCNHAPGECTADPVFQARLRVNARITEIFQGIGPFKAQLKKGAEHG